MAGSSSVPLWRSAATAVALTWRAAPALASGYVLCTAAGALMPVLAAWLTKLVLDAVVSGMPATRVVALAAGVALTGAGAVVTGAASRYVVAELGRRSARDTLARLYAATDRFIGLAPFEEPATLDRIQLAQQASNSTGQTVTDIATVAGGTITLIGFVGTLLRISPIATLIVLAAAAPEVFAELALSRRRATMVADVMPHTRREFFFAQLLNNATAAKESRLFGLGTFLRGRMLASRAAADAHRRRIDRRDGRTQSSLGLLSSLIAGGGLVWAALAARRGALTIGDVSMFIATIAGVQTAITALVTGIAGGQQRLLTFGHYVAVTGGGTDLPVAARPTVAPRLRTAIELRDVWFRYSDGHPWILRGVNLTIPAGTALALVGLNGAGKSTVVKLLCRLYDPTRGTIVWDGVDLREMDPGTLRDRISAVFQDHMCYDLTAAENVAVGDVSRIDDPDAVRAAAERAGAHDMLAALPRGYHTLLTRMFSSNTDLADDSTGVYLSGGQWQRVALARAFVRADRDLMILDEPSSGLDPEAEHDVHARMLRYRRGRTSLLISHRFNAIREADLIAVLDGGTIVEYGDHATLLAAGGTYARLFRLQASGYHEETASAGPMAVAG